MNWPQLSPKVRDTLTAMAAMLGAVSVALWRVGKPAVMLVLKALLALIVIFEEWGWEPLAALMARLGRLRPWALAEAWVAALPPYAALVVFVFRAPCCFRSSWSPSGYLRAAMCCWQASRSCSRNLWAPRFWLASSCSRSPPSCRSAGSSAPIIASSRGRMRLRVAFADPGPGARTRRQVPGDEVD